MPADDVELPLAEDLLILPFRLLRGLKTKQKHKINACRGTEQGVGATLPAAVPIPIMCPPPSCASIPLPLLLPLPFGVPESAAEQVAAVQDSSPARAVSKNNNRTSIPAPRCGSGPRSDSDSGSSDTGTETMTLKTQPR